MKGMTLGYVNPYRPPIKPSLKDKEKALRATIKSKHNKARELRFKAKRKKK